MAKASKDLISELEGTIDSAAAGLAKVAAKRMFGCHGLFADDSVFALVWKEGRIGVRLPDEDKFDELMNLKGATPWKAGKMTMSHWVLVPEPMHDDARALKKWVQVAHSLALAAPKASKPKKAKPTKKKAPKSISSKRSKK
jgi:TfoX/Sxy family transcriptional regulator of competence genes